MLIKNLILSIFLICILIVTGCSNSQPRDMGEIYSLVLDSYMPIDEGLNGGMQFIAIDMTNLKEIDDSDKKQIIKFFGKYDVEVMEATYEELIEKGLYNAETKVLNGILLRIDKTEISNNEIVVEGSKFRAGNGAIGTKVVVEFKDGKWQVTEAAGTWIS